MTARALIRRWQRRLQIQDWEISHETLPGAVMDGSGDGTVTVNGLCDTDRNFSAAHIRIRRGLDAATRERTIVHELLHVLREEGDEVSIHKISCLLVP